MKIPITFFVSLLFYCFHPSIQLLARGRFLKQSKFIVDQFYQLIVPPFKTLNVPDALVCTLKCVELNECLSFNLAISAIDGLKLCQLLSTDKYASPEKFKSSAIFNLYSVDIGLPRGVTSPPCETPKEFHRYYWIGQHACVCPKVPGAEYGWVKLNKDSPVHVEAKYNSYGIITIPQAGQIQRFKLVHISGGMSCWPSEPGYEPTNFGCGPSFHIFITDSNKDVIAPTSYGVEHMTYEIGPCAKTNDTQVVLPEITPFTVTVGQELQVWYGEDLLPDTSSETDNIGYVDMDVYANYTVLP